LTLAGVFAIAAGPSVTAAVAAPAPGAGCQLANGVKHVIEITFDNVHFNRDNPNVPSDIEQLPALKDFIESNGTMLSNNHTPMIAHHRHLGLRLLDRSGTGQLPEPALFGPGSRRRLTIADTTRSLGSLHPGGLRLRGRVHSQYRTGEHQSGSPARFRS
jgi:hypothetical protein